MFQQIGEGRGSQVVDGEILDELPEIQCKTCRDLKWVRREVPLDHPDFGKAFVCPDCASQIQQERLLRLRATLPEAQRELTFAGLKPHKPALSVKNQKLYDEAARFCQAYAIGEVDEPWLLLAGNPGWGKTHLAICIANYRLDHPDLNLPQANYTTFPDLLARLRRGFDNGEYDRDLVMYRECPLLILDDLGAEKDTGWTHEKLYEVLDHRYAGRLSTVITTNVPVEKADERIADRMMDTHTGLVRVFALDLPSFRTAKVWR